MQQKILCFCDNTFMVDVPEEINLDTDPQYIEDILAGNFMNFTCASCGKRHKPEFPLTVNWGVKKLHMEVLRELDRGEFYRR
ncbi:MAG: CpXC domain-containing protein, partial [Treponema sp.]|nr:CpXC domain-containing protein [Treponema sp.]